MAGVSRPRQRRVRPLVLRGLRRRSRPRGRRAANSLLGPTKRAWSSSLVSLRMMCASTVAHCTPPEGCPREPRGQHRFEAVLTVRVAAGAAQRDDPSVREPGRNSERLLDGGQDVSAPPSACRSRPLPSWSASSATSPGRCGGGTPLRNRGRVGDEDDEGRLAGVDADRRGRGFVVLEGLSEHAEHDVRVVVEEALLQSIQLRLVLGVQPAVVLCDGGDLRLGGLVRGRLRGGPRCPVEQADALQRRLTVPGGDRIACRVRAAAGRPAAGPGGTPGGAGQ